MRRATIKIEPFIALGLALGISLVVALSMLPAQAYSQKAGGNRSQQLPVTAPERAGMSGSRLAKIDEAVLDAIERKQTPGAVVLVGRKGRVVYRKAFGDRAVAPLREKMTEDTIFDLASLTKVVATATSIMLLVERGKLSLSDPVALFIPEFARFGKERVTVEQLLTHRAGLVPDNDISDYVGSSVDPLEEIYKLPLVYEPGSRFVYSDVGYIVAAEIVRRVSGRALDRFVEENLFAPLGMRETAWGSGVGKEPPFWSKEKLARTAPTEAREGRSMRGEVHDPRAYEMGGVAGHAGLFSTADDLAVFCQMFLNRGEYAGGRVLAPYTVERMLSAHSLPASQMRGIGWDVNTPFSSNRGDLFPVGTFGHTGFTGTSIWIDPQSRTFVVLLTNRVHPSGKGDVSRLRSLIASIVAGAITDDSTAPPLDFVPAPMRAEPPRAAITRTVPAGPLHPVLTGIDVLERDNLRQLEGRKIALITNHTGRARGGRSTIDVLASARNLKLVSIITPEHGLRGTEDAPIEEAGRDDKTGLPVHSIYARNRRRPTREMLSGADTLVFDVQDIGTRFYTYITTCAYAMEEAAKNKMKFVVLDRPNPIDGYTVEGPVADAEMTTDPLLSFTAAYALPVRHGMTVGEFARLYNSERKIFADLTVIKMEGWRRADYYDATGLAWVNPSPNMRSLTEALLYPGIGLLETTNLSVGRGTDTPFEVVGAPWIDEMKLGEALNRAGLAGVRFVPVRFTPKQSKFAGESCGGVNIIITDRNSFRPVATGIEIAYQLRRLYPQDWKIDDYIRLLANRAAFEALKAGKSAQETIATWQGGLSDFARVRRQYLLY